MMKKNIFTFASALVATILSTSVFGATYYVTPTGSGDGTTEANPCNLTTGWSKFSGANTIELVLADGTYNLTEPLSASLPNGGNFGWTIRSKSNNPASCIINGQNNVRCLNLRDGGYDASYNRYARIKGLTIKNGLCTTRVNNEDGGGAVRIQGILENCIIEDSKCDNPTGDAWGGGVMVFAGSVISNCIIRNCHALSHVNDKQAVGGGIACWNSGGVTIADVQILNCSAKCYTTKGSGQIETGGGGIFTYGLVITGRNILIDGCEAINLESDHDDSVKGGGIYKRFGNDTFENLCIKNCRSGLGGGFFDNNDASLTFNNCTFSGNEAQVTGGGLYIRGATDTRLTKCVIKDNTAARVPAIYGSAGSIIDISDSVIRNNDSTSGSETECGLIQLGRGGSIRNTVIENNDINTGHASYGGLVSCYSANRADSLPFMFETLIVKNNTSFGAETDANRSVGFNDPILKVNNQPNDTTPNANGFAYTNITFRNCYFTGNTASSIAGVYNRHVYKGLDDDGVGIYFKNCTFSGNTFGATSPLICCKKDDNASKCMVNLRNCDLRGNTGSGTFFDSVIYSVSSRRADHCAIESTWSNISTEPALGNQFSGDVAGKGAYEEWMNGAQDGGDGTFTETASSTYGVTVSLNNKGARRQGARPDIGARETNEGGTPPSPDAFDAQIKAYLNPTSALVMVEGESINLPALGGGAAYENLSGHRFLSIDGNVLTALSAGIGSFKAYNKDGIFLGIVPVFIKPSGRQFDRVFIFKQEPKNQFTWSDSSTWAQPGCYENADFPDGINDLVFIPAQRHGDVLLVDGSYSLASLFMSYIQDAFSLTFTLQGSLADGSASLSFYGTTGKKGCPAVLMAAHQGKTYGLNFNLRGSNLASKLNINVARGDLNLDCGGPLGTATMPNSDDHMLRWYSDSAFIVFNVPSGSTLRLVNGIRHGGFGDSQMGAQDHVRFSGADMFTGNGVIEFNSNSSIGFWSYSFRSFTGTVRSQTLNYIRNLHENRSGIFWTVNVDSPELVGEINGYVTREFNPSKGVGAWVSGNSHGYGDPGSMLGNGLPGKLLVLNGGDFYLYGFNKTGSDTTFTKRSDGYYEAHYETEELRIGKGLSYLSNAYNVDRSATGVIAHFEADTLTHSDPCGTFRVSDPHFRLNLPVGSKRAETRLRNFSSYYVGYNSSPNYSSNIFPIVPWAIGQSDDDATYFWWLGVNEEGYVMRRGNRTNVDRNAMQVNQNAYVNGHFNLSADKNVNSLILRNTNETKTLGTARTLTIQSGALGLENENSSLGTQTGGMDNGAVVFEHKAFVYPTSNNSNKPNQIWSRVRALDGFVVGYPGYLLLAGDQSQIKGELTLNNGTTMLGSLDGTVPCYLGVDEVRAIGGNTVLQINMDGSLDGKIVRFEGPGGLLPKFNLKNAQTEYCNKLYIDGVTLRSGIWGATGSGAPNINDTLFTGTGTLCIRHDDLNVGFSMVFRP